jgi:hypothetical protein
MAGRGKCIHFSPRGRGKRGVGGRLSTINDPLDYGSKSAAKIYEVTVKKNNVKTK